MLSNVRPIAEREMLLSWAHAEAGNQLQNCVDAAVRRKALDGSTLGENDIAQLVRAAAFVRSPLLDFFRLHETHWFTADFPAAELGAVRVVNFFARDSPSRTLAELAQRRPEIGAFKFDASITKGRPIFVAPAASGPWCLMEGTHRCCSILRENAGGAPSINSVPIIAGICAVAAEWPWWK
jgi:hypothetical protein